VLKRSAHCFTLPSTTSNLNVKLQRQTSTSNFNRSTSTSNITSKFNVKHQRQTSTSNPTYLYRTIAKIHRCSEDNVPTPLAALYYGQRSSGGLLISEGTCVSQEAMGWPWRPRDGSDQPAELKRGCPERVCVCGVRVAAR
jgi:hypothetical protein